MEDAVVGDAFNLSKVVAEHVAAEKARVEMIRRELFAQDSCAACGALVGDQVQHAKFHEALDRFSKDVGDAFGKLAGRR